MRVRMWRVRQGIIVGVPDAADGGFDACLLEAFGVADRDVLDAPVAVVDQRPLLERTPGVQGLFQRIQHEIGAGRAGHLPADDATGEDVDDEGNKDEALPGADVGEVRHPQGIGGDPP